MRAVDIALAGLGVELGLGPVAPEVLQVWLGRARALATSTMFTTLVLMPLPRPSILA